APLQVAGQGNAFHWAKISHQQFHQNVPGLVHQFHLLRDQPRAIVATCPQCQGSTLTSLGAGVNPRGLQSCEIWQTDVT
ncbi:POK19 protein, partial [Spizella passerina]|nr:POK19 protein [Spizella passerina]